MSDSKILKLDVGTVALAAIVGAGGWIVWDGWIGLGHLCGFGGMTPALPFGVEAYAALALRSALQPGETSQARTCRRFSWATAGAALLLGCAAQAMYHVMAAHHDKAASTLVIIVVSCLPVLAIGLGAALLHMLHAAKVAEAAVQIDKDRERDAADRQRQQEIDAADRAAQHELEMERLRQSERDQLRQEAQEEEARKRAAAEQARHDRDTRRAAALAVAGQRHDPSVTPSVTAAVAAGVRATVSAIESGRVSGPWLPTIQAPEDARVTTTERQSMWNLWHNEVTTNQRMPNGAELNRYAGCLPASSLGRQMAFRWRTIEPAASLIASQQDGETGS